MEGWQPIETAPRDGTVVHLKCESRPDFSQQVMYWDNNRGWWAGYAFALMRRVSTYWDPEAPQPTHWRPRGTNPEPN